MIKEKILISRVITLDTGNTHEIIQHFLSRVMTLDKENILSSDYLDSQNNLFFSKVFNTYFEGFDPHKKSFFM